MRASLLKEYVDLFNQCYPQFAMMEESFEKLLLREGAQVLEEREEPSASGHDDDGKLLGYAIVEECALRLICVSLQAQRRGIGSKLLARAEELVRSNGMERIITGGVSSGFLIGADKNAWPFFEKNGYRRVGECDEMLLDLSEYRFETELFHGHEKAKYDWYQGDLDALHQAVESVDEDWVQYFTDPKHVYVGMVGDEIASFCLVDTGWQNYLSDTYGKIGAPGCVGTVPKFRNQGIALEMVARATQHLKEAGMDISFIFFTGVAAWYQKIGYRIFMTEIFGEKSLLENKVKDKNKGE